MCGNSNQEEVQCVLDAMSVYVQRRGVQVSEGCKVVTRWLEHTKLTA